ncbi:hypothetical protein JYK14_13070, partial [Siccirubricoccus sp. KC 17139]
AAKRASQSLTVALVAGSASGRGRLVGIIRLLSSAKPRAASGLMDHGVIHQAGGCSRSCVF